MPIYEYICEDCGEETEVIQKISDEPLKTCPSCSQDSLKKKTSMSAFHLKGGGWYKDGYGDGNSGTTTSGSTAPSTTESSKPDASATSDSKKGDESKKTTEKAAPKKETTSSTSSSAPSSKAS